MIRADAKDIPRIFQVLYAGEGEARPDQPPDQADHAGRNFIIICHLAFHKTCRPPTSVNAWQDLNSAVFKSLKTDQCRILTQSFTVSLCSNCGINQAVFSDFYQIVFYVQLVSKSSKPRLLDPSVLLCMLKYFLTT